MCDMTPEMMKFIEFLVVFFGVCILPMVLAFIMFMRD
jgi:hypothetical protein